MRSIAKYFFLITLCLIKAQAETSCPTDYDSKNFACSSNSASQLGRLLHDHRYTDSLTLSTSSCKTDLKNSFATPAELERFFSSDPNVSVGAPPDIITKCNSSDLLPGPKHNEEVKASIAEYYTDLARLNNAVKETLQSIAAIDSLKGQPLLAGVDCSIPELKDAKDFCAILRSSCQPAGGNFEIAVKAKQNLIEKKKLLEQITWFNQNPNGPVQIIGVTRNGPIKQHNLSDDQKEKLDQAKIKIQELEDDTPIIRDNAFAMKEINDAAKNNFDKNPNNPENISKLSNEVFSKAEWDNNSNTRDLLLERLNQLRGASSCLGGHGDCSKFDEVMEMDASTEIPFLNIDPKADLRTQQGLRAYNSGLCQSQARRKARQHGKMGTSIVSALGLTAASFFIPPLAESAGIAWAGALAIRSIDTYYAIDAGVDTYKKCQTQLDQFHTIVQREAKSSGAFCPKSSDQPKANALQNVYECEKGIAMIVPAVLPVLTAAAKDVAVLGNSADAENAAISVNKSILKSESTGTNNSFLLKYPNKQEAQILDDISTQKVSVSVGNAKLVQSVQDSWNSKGILSEMVTQPDGTQYLRVVPADPASLQQTSSLNRLAAGLKKYDPNFELVYDPSKISSTQTGTQAMVLQSEHKLIMSHIAAIEGSANDPLLVHEVIHANTDGQELKGILHPYQIMVRADDPKAFSIAKRTAELPSSFKEITKGNMYSDYMRFDELVTFRYNLWKSARNYTKAIRESDSNANTILKSLENFTISNLIISDRANLSSKLAESALDTLKKSGNLNWGKTTKFSSDGLNYKGIVQLGSEAGGKKFIAISIEEIPGILSKKKDITGFQMLIPVQSETSEKSQIPSSLISQYLSDIRSASADRNVIAKKSYDIYTQLEHPENLSLEQKNQLMQELENITSQGKPMPGYPTHKELVRSPSNQN